MFEPMSSALTSASYWQDDLHTKEMAALVVNGWTS